MEPNHSIATRQKLWLIFSLGILVTVPYFYLQRHLLFPAWMVPTVSFDRMLPFVPATSWLYVSLYLQIMVPLFLARDARELRTMIFGFVWIVLISHFVFLFWPTAIPDLLPANVAQELSRNDSIMRLILASDTSFNACPSLHASLAIYCVLCSNRFLGIAGKLGLWSWTLLILAATLLTKRHVMIDLGAGAFLGFAAYVALFAKRPAEPERSDAMGATLRARIEVSRGLEPEIEKLIRHDSSKRLWEFLCFGLFEVAAVTLILWARSARLWPLEWFGIVLSALSIHAFVLLLHEGMHDSLFESPFWNRWVSVVLGWMFWMSYSAYRVLHNRHHYYLGEIRDPDDYQNYVRQKHLLWLMHFMRLICGTLLYLGLIPLLALRYGSDQERRRILVEYGLLLVVYSILFRLVPLPTLAVAWGIPLLIVGLMTGIRGFTQHGITDATDPYLASRTILPHPVTQFFVLQENFHLEHHFYPEVPSYHLEGLHKLIWPRLPRKVTGRSYLGFLLSFLRATPRMEEAPIGLDHHES